MAMNLEIAQFDSTDSWEDRTLKKLNSNFRQVQGAFGFLQSSLPSSSSISSGGKELIWRNTDDPLADQPSLTVSLPNRNYDCLLVTWRISDQSGNRADFYMSQLVPYRSNFVLNQISAGGAAPHYDSDAIGFIAYAKNVSYDSQNHRLNFGKVQRTRPSDSWQWTDDQHAMIIMEIYGINF